MEKAKTDSKLVLLDRDGTINVDHGYVTQPEQIDLIPGAAEAIGLLKEAGFICVIVSNQSAIGRGMASVTDVERTNRRLEEALLEEHPSAKLDLFLYAPDAPDGASDRRKPRIGMYREVESLYTIDVRNSWMIGDKPSDVEFGINAGLPTKNCLLVLTGEGKKSKSKLPDAQPTFASLLPAVRHILKTS